MITVYTDGACSGNPGPGGWCAIIDLGYGESTIFGTEESTTNNRMELTAVLRALEYLPYNSDVTVVSDSKYVCDAYNKGWLSSWSKNGWRTAAGKPVANQELWASFLNILFKMRSVKFQWVQGHAGHPQNERCDQIASRLAKGLPLDGSGEEQNNKKPTAAESYAVVFSYSFDHDVAVYLFDTQEEAAEYLKKSVQEEFRIDTEENGWASSYDISEDGLYGVVKNHFPDRTDVTEVRVGSVYHK